MNIFKNYYSSVRTIRISALVKNHTLIDINNEDEKSKTKRKKATKYSTQLEQYLCSDERMKEIKHLLPHKLYQLKLSPPEALYIVDPLVAKTFVSKIKNKITSPKNSFIMEINPGVGVLTKELLHIGVKNIESFESMVHFYNYLKTQQFNVKLGDLLAIWKLAHQDRFDNGNRVANILVSVPKKPWCHDSVMKIVGAVPNNNLIKHLIFSIVFQTSIALYGRPELFVALPPSVYNSLTCNSSAGYMSYRASSVLFQIFFDWEILHVLPRSAFLPWQANKKTKKSEKQPLPVDWESIYLVRITPKRNLPVAHDQLKPLWYFVKHHMLSRSGRVIPQLERWIPGCGAKIIAQSSKGSSHIHDIGIFTEFGELSPQQILQLFRLFVSFPEYSDSPFLASMESRLVKMDTSNDSISSLDLDSETIETSAIGTNVDEQQNSENDAKSK